MHDTYCLPGDAAYEPEPLDCHQAITVQLHHLELAFNQEASTSAPIALASSPCASPSPT